MNDDDLATLLRQARETSEANSDAGVERRPPPPTVNLPWWLGLFPLLGLVLLAAAAAFGVWYFYSFAVDIGFLPGGDR